MRRRLRIMLNRWNAVPSYERSLVWVLGLTIALYAYVTSTFPPYINDQVVYSIATVLLNVEGFIFALTTQIKHRGRKLTVATGLVTILFSVITISKAYFESIQLKYLSFAETTYIFDTDIILFGLFVGLYAAAVLAQDTVSES